MSSSVKLALSVRRVIPAIFAGSCCIRKAVDLPRCQPCLSGSLRVGSSVLPLCTTQIWHQITEPEVPCESESVRFHRSGGVRLTMVMMPTSTFGTSPEQGSSQHSPDRRVPRTIGRGYCRALSTADSTEERGARWTSSLVLSSAMGRPRRSTAPMGAPSYPASSPRTRDA